MDGEQTTTMHPAIESKDTALSAVPESVFEEGIQRGSIDIILVLAIAALVGIGTLAVYTGSSWSASQNFGNSMHFVHHHLVGVGIGVAGLLVANRVDYRWYRDLTRPLLAVTVLLLVLTLIPGIGMKINGARRWLNLGVAHFQPAELAKFTVCVFMAYSMEKRREAIQHGGAFLGHAFALSVLIFPLIIQPDFGSSVIVTSIVAVMLYLGGARWSHLVVAALVFVLIGMAAIFTQGYRVARVMTWLNPWDEVSGRSWQLINAWIALARGGFTGTGFGQGFSMFGFVPEMHNDFVAAVIGEEFGWFGFVIFIVLFGIVAWRGYRISTRCKELFGAYLAFALTTLIVGQAAVNLCVVTGLLPTKGLTLPFVSYGRSSIVILLTIAGILLNISQNNVDVRRLRVQARDTARTTLHSKQQAQRWRKERMAQMRHYAGRDDEQ